MSWIPVSFFELHLIHMSLSILGSKSCGYSYVQGIVSLASVHNEQRYGVVSIDSGNKPFFSTEEDCLRVK